MKAIQNSMQWSRTFMFVAVLASMLLFFGYIVNDMQQRSTSAVRHSGKRTDATPETSQPHLRPDDEIFPMPEPESDPRQQPDPAQTSTSTALPPVTSVDDNNADGSNQGVASICSLRSKQFDDMLAQNNTRYSFPSILSTLDMTGLVLLSSL